MDPQPEPGSELAQRREQDGAWEDLLGEDEDEVPSGNATVAAFCWNANHSTGLGVLDFIEVE